MALRATLADTLRSSRWQLLLLVAVAAAMRAAALIHGDAVVSAHGDEFYYLRAGTSIAEGLGHPGSFRPPLYPALIGSVFFVAGSSLTVLRWVQVLISLAAVVLVHAICRERFGSRAAFGSALACALSPPLIHFTHFLWSETLFVTLFLLFLWLIRRFDGSGRTGFLVGAALALALSALTKEIAVIFAVLMLPWFALRGDRCRRTAARHALIFMICFLVPVVPWTVRNWRAQGAFVGLSTCRWFPIATGNLRAEDAIRGTDQRVAFLARWRGMSDEVERESVSREAALRSIGALQPWWIVHKARLNLPRLFSPKGQEIRFLELGLYPPRAGSPAARGYALAGLAGHLVLVGSGLMALWLVRGDPLKWLVLLMTAYSIGVYLIANATPRFLVPLLPLFFLYVGPWWAGVSRDRAPWRWAGAVVTVALFVLLVLARVPADLGPVWTGSGGG